MKTITYKLLFLGLLFTSTLTAQNIKLSGFVKDAYTNEPLPFVNIVIYERTTGTTTDKGGRFSFENMEPGFIRLQLSFIGYKSKITEEIRLSPTSENYIEISLVEKTTNLEEVKVTASPFPNKQESPVSLRRIGISEIEKGAGSNRDLAKVLQSFPGIGGSAGFRNDLVVRGGGPSENRFFLDGIEIPVLNHFSTQGSTGGPVGLLNVDFIREVDFYSGAFPANRGGALSSVFEFKQIDANPEDISFKATVGASEFALSTNAPLSENTGLLFSVRRSYLQFIFDQLGLPFLPTYNDFQFRTRTRFNKKNELILLGVGAIDQFKINESAEKTEENQYILGHIPDNGQWNYTLGASFKHFLDESYLTVAVSRNHLNNYAEFKNKPQKHDKEIQKMKYNSHESENKLRFEWHSRSNTFSINTGFNFEAANYFNKTKKTVFREGKEVLIDYESDLNLLKYGLFGTISRNFIDERLSLSLGLRMDGNDYSNKMNNPLKQFSPRFSAAYHPTPVLSINFNTGQYFQLPAYTTLGYRNNEGTLKNKENAIEYINANHLIAGVEWRPNKHTRISIESFWKKYANYPFSLTDSVSLASKEGNFGAVGDEAVASISQGRSKGMEIMTRQKSPRGHSFILAYTLVQSDFTDHLGNYIPSNWDNEHLLTFTYNKSFRNNWDFGLRWRYIGGKPYTPYDLDKSERKIAWDLRRREYLDYKRFNKERLDPFHQLDLRVDKTWIFSDLSLSVYIDIQNVYNNKNNQPPVLIQNLNDREQPIIQNPDALAQNQRYQLKELTTSDGTILPSIGITMEF